MTGTIELLDWISTNNPLIVRPWRDERVEAIGYGPRSEYVETFWLTVLGPSCVLVLRRFGWWLELQPDGFEVPIEDLARTVGLGTGAGRRAPIVRTLARLVEFNLALIDGSHYAIRVALPPLVPRQVARLPRFLIDHHSTLQT